jgi:hypothetical protein
MNAKRDLLDEYMNALAPLHNRLPQGCFNGISGVVYPALPQAVVRLLPLQTLANPKPLILMAVSPRLFWSRRFSGLMSLYSDSNSATYNASNQRAKGSVCEWGAYEG